MCWLNYKVKLEKASYIFEEEGKGESKVEKFHFMFLKP